MIDSKARMRNRRFYWKHHEELLLKNREKGKRLYLKNRDRILAKQKLRRLSNPDSTLEIQRRSYLKNIEKRRSESRERTKIWKKENPQKYKDALMRWRKKNRGMINYYGAMRHSAILTRTPSWANKEEIKAIYQRAQEVTCNTGVIHHVDHIYPLRHALFSGLNVSWNLRIVPWLENLTKGNRVDKSMLHQKA
jgi:hypothetical protein